MRLRDPVELLYLSLMLRWEHSAPPDKTQGYLDGEPERNTQTARLAYIISKVAAGNEEQTYQVLSRHSQRSDGKSYVSKDKAWMKQPYPLLDGWHFEGCTSLIQKQQVIQSLIRLKLSPAFVACADDFIAGKSVESYQPTEEESQKILRKIKAKEATEQESGA